MKQLTTYVLTFVFCLITMGNAEMRIWTDKKGNTIEAEFEKMYGSKAVLQSADGRTMYVPAQGLSDDDQEYLATVTAVPPKLIATVDEDIESDKNSSSYPETIREIVTLEASVRKRNPEPCLQRFTAYLYVLGREPQESQLYCIVDVRKHEVTFLKGDLFTFEEVFRMNHEVGYSWSRGYAYQGYMLCVVDDMGEVVAMDTDQNILERNLSIVLKSSKNDTFDEEFRKVR